MAYEKELEFAEALASEAGKIMRRYFKADDIGIVWKQDDTPLTVADTAINDLVIERVRQKFPDHDVIGEEASFGKGGAMVWVLDPIDGTMPFSLGIPISTFSLGLVDRSDGQAVLGVVYDPQLDELYSAVRGQGAFVNNRPIHTATASHIKNTYISIIGGTDKQKNTTLYKAGSCTDLARAEGAKVFSFYSQVYAALKVATGDFSGSIFGYGSPRDSAAASVLVEEAGGVVTDAIGKIRRFDEWGEGCLLAANAEVHAGLLRLIRAAK